MSTLTHLNQRIRGSIPRSTLDWLRIGLVLAVLVLSLTIGYKIRPVFMTYILYGVALIPVVMTLLRWPKTGITLILLTGLFVNYSGPGGLNATVLLVMLLAGLWVVDQVIFKTEIRIVASAVMPPLVGLVLIASLAFAMGQYPWFLHAKGAPLDAQAAGFSLYVLSFLALMLVANQIKNLADLKQITYIFVVLSSINVIGLIIPTTRSIVTSVAGTIGSVYWIWSVALLYGQLLFNDELKKRSRFLLGVALAAALYVLFVQKFDNKSGWVPVLVALWAMTMLRSWKFGAVMSVLALFGGLILFPEIMNSESYSLSTRLEILPILWAITLANPIFGVGFGNYYFFAQQFSVRGWYVTINSHNNYVDIVAQIGLLGILFFIWFVLQIGALGMRLRSRVQTGFEKAYVHASLGALLGMVVVMALGDWVLPFVYNIGLAGFRSSVMGWVFLGGLVVIEQLANQREEEQAEAIRQAV